MLSEPVVFDSVVVRGNQMANRTPNWRDVQKMLKCEMMLRRAAAHLLKDWQENVCQKEDASVVDEFFYGEGFDQALVLIGCTIKRLNEERLVLYRTIHPRR